MKVPYYRVPGDYGYDWYELNHTGKCKIVTGGAEQYETGKYYEHQITGLFRRKIWVHERDVKLFDEKTVTYNDCKGPIE